MADLNLYPQPGLAKIFSDEVLAKISRSTGFITKVSRLEDSFWECYRADREQFDAGCILECFQKYGNADKSVIITDVDIFLPIFTFVFGLAQLGGQSAIISTHRLKNEFYGLPHNKAIYLTRIVKEIIHEFGHLLGMKHCPNYSCVMASSNTTDDLDIKGDEYCKSCKKILNV